MHCDGCRWFKIDLANVDVSEPLGSCNRLPPTVYPMGVDPNGAIQTVSLRPRVQRLAPSCGEWDPELPEPGSLLS